MVKLLLLLLAILPHEAVLAEPASVSEENNGGDGRDSVLVLDSVSLEAEMQQGRPLMVNFYAPWCGHCKELEPEYARAATDLRPDGLLLGKVDCDVNEKLCDEDRWDIEGFPTIKVLRGGVGGPIHDYNGPRAAEDIVSFMRQVATFLPPEGVEDDGDYDLDADDDDFDSEDDGVEDYLPEENGVLVLGGHNFEVATDRFMIMLVLLYTPGCEGCADLMEEYAEASDELYEYLIPVSKVDCFTQAGFCQQPRWTEAAAKAAGTAADAASDPQEPPRAMDGKAPMLFVVKEGEVFGYGGGRPFMAFDVVEFTKGLAGISGELPDYEELDDDDDEMSGDDAEVDESNVLVLDESSIDQALEDDGVLLLEFFAPWCGNCKRLQPRYARAADALKKEGNVARLAKIDCTTNEALCAKEPWRIDKFPTIMLRRFGKLYEYDHAPEAKDLVLYMRKATEPALKRFTNEFELNKLVEENEVAVIGILEKEGSGAHLKFQAAAEADFGRLYGVTFDDKMAEMTDVETGNRVIIFRHFESQRLSMKIYSFTKKEDIEAFVKGASKKLFLELGTEEASRALSKRPVAMFFFTNEERVASSESKYMMELAQEMAENALVPKNGDSATPPVLYVHASMDEVGFLLMDFLVGEANHEYHVPGVFLVAPGEDEKAFKYIFDREDLTLEELQQFERRYFAGELEPHFKSETLSPTDEVGPLKTVKTDSFERMVIDTDNDVLVSFYAPWCPHCQRLRPILEDLAEKMEGREKLVIADMDTTANDLEYLNVSTTTLPTVVMFKAGAKDQPERYEGELELEPLEAFINEKAYHKQAPEEGVVGVDAVAETAAAPSRDEL